MMASMRTTLATHKMGDDRNQIAANQTVGCDGPSMATSM